MITTDDIDTMAAFGIGHCDNYWIYENGTPMHIKKSLSEALIRGHLAGKLTLGNSPFMDNLRVKFCATDIDGHTEGLNESDAKKVIEDAKTNADLLYKYLHELGVPVVMNSSGGNGYHVRVCSLGMTGRDARAFMARAQIESLGSIKHEIFPKQDSLTDAHPFGSQMKLFLGIHPRTHNWSNLIVDGKLVSQPESIEHMKQILDAGGFIPAVSDADRELLAKPKPEFVAASDVPEYCPFIETIAVNHILPSGIKTRHHCLDPQLAGYTHGRKQDVLDAYSERQGRHSDTAFKNWQNYWADGKPQFNCGSIVNYLRAYPDNELCTAGLKLCAVCSVKRNYEQEKQMQIVKQLDGWLNAL